SSCLGARALGHPDPGAEAVAVWLGAGHSWATISAVLFCSFSTISRWKQRFEKEGVDAVFGRPRGRRRSGIHTWAALVVQWVLTCSPWGCMLVDGVKRMARSF